MYLNSFNKNKYIYWNVNGITTMTNLKKKPKKKPTPILLHILTISESE